MGYCACGYDIYDDCKKYECRKYLPRELAKADKEFREEQNKALQKYQYRISMAIYNAEKGKER